MSDAATAEAVSAAITAFLERIEKPGEFDAGTALYADGLGIDSLETAELSALLEDEFGSDPFNSAAEMPETVGDILGFYGATTSAA